MTQSLMEYLDTPKAPAHGADKYFGAVATGYDQKRQDDPKWQIEQEIIEAMLDGLPEGFVILDAPCGTGRFFKKYIEKRFVILGLDKSADMLHQAAQKVDPKKARGELRVGDVRNTGLPDKSVDCAVNVRITRWLTPDECQQMFREMQRVSRHFIIWTARVENHPHARSRALFEAALMPGWQIVRDVPGHEMAYRVLAAERVA